MPSSSLKFSKLLAVDPSLSCSGWALFSIDRLMPLEAGTISPPGPKLLPLAKRLEFLQEEILSLISRLALGAEDYLITEGPAPLVKNPSSATKVEQVRSTFEVLARNYGLNVPGRINPRTVQSEILGLRGPQIPRNEVKAHARAVVDQLYGRELEKICFDKKEAVSQDIIDALLIGSYAAGLLKNSILSEIPAWKFFLPKQKNSSKRSGAIRWSAQDVNRINKKARG